MKVTNTLLVIFYYFELCSLRKTSKKRILDVDLVWGWGVEIKDYPYMVGLIDKTTNQYFCAGTIIRVRWVLTAARCIVNVEEYQDTGEIDVYHPYKDRNVIVRGNTTYIDGSDHYKLDHKVTHYIFHEDIDLTRPQIIENDVGLLKVQEPFSGVFETSVVLREFATNVFGKPAYQVGWGAMLMDPPVPKIKATRLRLKTVAVASHGLCRLHTITTEFNPHKKLCIRPLLFNRICNGDSGSPVVFLWRQIGIVTTNLEGCPDSEIYITDPKAHEFWIKSSISRHQERHRKG